jgi:hypothetical protein
MSDGGPRKKIKIRIKGQSPTGSRAGSPAPGKASSVGGSRAGSPAVQAQSKQLLPHSYFSISLLVLFSLMTRRKKTKVSQSDKPVEDLFSLFMRWDRLHRRWKF